MADNGNGARAGTPLRAILIAAAAVFVVIGLVTFVMDNNPGDAADPSADIAEQRPTGAGTVPEGEADSPDEGITDEEAAEATPASEGGAVATEGGEAGDMAADSAEGTDAESDEPAVTPGAETSAPVPEEAEGGQGDDAGFETGDPETTEDVVTDPDGEGEGFNPTPSGPAGRDGNSLTVE